MPTPVWAVHSLLQEWLQRSYCDPWARRVLFLPVGSALAVPPGHHLLALWIAVSTQGFSLSTSNTAANVCTSNLHYFLFHELYVLLLLVTQASGSNPCTQAGQPCQNGGTCVNSVYGYTCKCLSGYFGRRCEYGQWSRHFISTFNINVDAYRFWINLWILV